MMKHPLLMIKYLFMNHLPIFSRWLWKYVVYIINISLLSQIIGNHFRWYLCSIFSFRPTKYSFPATDLVRNPPTLLQISRKSLFFFQQCTRPICADRKRYLFIFEILYTNMSLSSDLRYSIGFTPYSCPTNKTTLVCTMYIPFP